KVAAVTLAQELAVIVEIGPDVLERALVPAGVVSLARDVGVYEPDGSRRAPAELDAERGATRIEAPQLARRLRVAPCGAGVLPLAVVVPGDDRRVVVLALDVPRQVGAQRFALCVGVDVDGREHPRPVEFVEDTRVDAGFDADEVEAHAFEQPNL